MSLLVETVSEVRPASRQTLERRLRDCLAEREARVRARGADRFGRCVSDQWLELDIQTLERALQEKA